MNSLHKVKISIIRLVGLVVVILLGFLTTVGSGGGDDYVEDEPNIGWIEISYYYIQVDDTGVTHAHLSGSAFVNSAYTAHNCSGLCCLLCIYDDSYPGVDVSWLNQTTGITGMAASRYGTATDWVHYWYADVPLVLGTNIIDVYASDPAGNYASASISIDNMPAPEQIIADSGNSQITISWKNITGADSYNIYWLTTPGVTKANGIAIPQVSSPYIHNELINGLTYYYVITTNYSGLESSESTEVSAIAGVPSRPVGVTAEATGSDVTITWTDSPETISYNLYWLNEPNVTKSTGNLIPNVTSPYLHSSLYGIPYYYIVTAINSYGESWASTEVMALPEAPPPAPSGLTVTQRSRLEIVDISWDPVPGSFAYDLDRCIAWCYSSPGFYEAADCLESWKTIYNGPEAMFVDWDVEYRCYRYRVSTWNMFGESLPSDDVGIFLKDPYVTYE